MAVIYGSPTPTANSALKLVSLGVRTDLQEWRYT